MDPRAIVRSEGYYVNGDSSKFCNSAGYNYGDTIVLPVNKSIIILQLYYIFLS